MGRQRLKEQGPLGCMQVEEARLGPALSQNPRPLTPELASLGARSACYPAKPSSLIAR